MSGILVLALKEEKNKIEEEAYRVAKNNITLLGCSQEECLLKLLLHLLYLLPPISSLVEIVIDDGPADVVPISDGSVDFSNVEAPP